eukprot:scaffold12985_cov17-Tisochrysis_lutea.AAC.1
MQEQHRFQQTIGLKCGERHAQDINAQAGSPWESQTFMSKQKTHGSHRKYRNLGHVEFKHRVTTTAQALKETWRQTHGINVHLGACWRPS